MQNIQLRFSGQANFSQTKKEVATLQAQFAALQKQLAASTAGAGGVVNTAPFKHAQAELATLRSSYVEALQASGQFDVVQQKLTTNTQRLTDKLRQQKLGMFDVIRQWKGLKDVYRQQMALQQMSLTQWKTDPFGRVDVDMVVPKDAERRVMRFTDTIKLANAALRSSSEQLINWGKNTQWAGRQIMVGLTVPTAMFGVAAGALAYQVESEMVRVQKVYDTTAQDLAGQERELAQLRADSYEMASRAANLYGSSVKDTLNVEAALAQTGVRGTDLLQATSESLRIATLGELEYQQAVDMTIALQNAFGLSTEQLTQKLNFMNSVENATSLSIQDIAEATPRAASALAGVGVSVEEMVILLTAMRERGVDAAEGANALKSATTRLLNPTRQAREAFAAINVDIAALAEKNGGNLFMTLKDISAAMADLDDFSKQQLIGKLFGTYQFNRLNAALAGIADAYGGVADESSQTARAVEVAGQDISEHAQTAQQELQRWQQSAPGQFKRALESVKAELAELGGPFLEMGAGLMRVLSDVLNFFNNMPDAAKKAALGITVFLALLGPIVMFIGIFANAIGTVVKFITTLTGLATRFKVVTAEERAASLLARQAATGFDTQATAAEVLRRQISELTMGIEALNAAQRDAMIASKYPVAQNVSQNASGGFVYTDPKTGRSRGALPHEKNQYLDAAQAENVARSMNKQAVSAGVIANSAEETKRHWGTTASYMITGASALGLMLAPTNQLLNILLQASFVASMIGPSIASGLRKTKVMDKLKADVGNLKNAFTGTTFVGGLRNALSASGGLLANFMKLAGPAGLIAAAGIGAYAIYRNIKKAGEEQKALNSSAQAWSEILGYTYQTGGTETDPETGEQVKSVENYAEALREAKPELVNYLRSLKDAGDEQAFLNAVMKEGMRVLQTGGTAEQAYTAMEAALESAGARLEEREDFMIQIKAQVNFEDMASQVENTLKIMENSINAVMSNDFDVSGWEGLTRQMSGTDELNSAAREAAKGVAQDFWNAFSQMNDVEQREFFDGFVEMTANTYGKIFENVSASSGEALKAAGIDNAEEFFKKYNEWLELSKFNLIEFRKLPPELHVLFNGLDKDTRNWIGRVNSSQQEIARGIGRSAGLGDAAVDSISNMADVARHLGMATMSMTDAEKGYEQALRLSSQRRGELSEQEKLAILNSYRAAAGLENATSSTQGFGAAAAGAAGQVEQLNDAMNEMTGLEDADWINASKDAFSQTMNDVYSEADRIFNDQMQSDLDSIANAGEARLDALDRAAEAREAEYDARQEAMENAFDAAREAQEAKWDAALESFDQRWDNAAEKLRQKQDKEVEEHEKRWDDRMEAEEAAFDARIQAIEDAIDAEQKAEEIRQRIFEAEQRRIERAANMFARNIDFNMALNSGELDEAAKIMNDAQAETAGWAVDDAAESSQTASEKRIEDLQKEIDKVEEAKDARLEALREIQEAERKALEEKQRLEQLDFERRRELERKDLEERRKQEQKILEAQQERQRKALEQERQNYQRSLAATREKVQEEIRQNQNAAQRSWEAKRRALENELRTLKAFIPQNEQQLQQHIGRVDGAYNRFGVDLKSKGLTWSQYIASQFATNMRVAGENLKNQVAWDNVGAAIAREIIAGAFDMTPQEFAQWIVNGKIPKGGISGVQGDGTRFTWNMRHDGGMIGGGGNSRTGIPRSASMYPSEVGLLAKRGEYVMSQSAVRQYGADFMDSVNKGEAQGGAMGMSGIFAAMAMGAATSAIKMASEMAMARSMVMATDAIAGKPGQYGGTKFDAHQLGNAATIMSVGRSLGASDRDLVIALMTAMQESMLRNLTYGDRDSVGLFQQRNAWGSFEDRTNPSKAARMFFLGGAQGQRGLLDFKNRDKMSLTQAAQAVQVSAFPNAYAKWEDEARAILSGTSFAPGNNISAGGWVHPLKPGPYSIGRGGAKHGYPAQDFPSPAGTPIKAMKGGIVTKAVDLTRSYGRHVVVAHPDGWSTLYAHMSRRMVNKNNVVSPGQVLGLVGTTGNSTGNHLHLETLFNGLRKEPRSVVPQLWKGADIRFDNTLANLHKDETVLTAPLSRDLKDGIRSLDNGGGNHYTIDMRESTFTAEIDVERAVVNAINKIENAKGRSRKVGDKK